MRRIPKNRTVTGVGRGVRARYSDGSSYETADDNCSEDGATPEEALVRLLASCCLEWDRLPDGKEGWLFFDVVRYDGEVVKRPGCKGVATPYKTRMDLRIAVPRRIAHDGKRRVKVLKFEEREAVDAER